MPWRALVIVVLGANVTAFNLWWLLGAAFWDRKAPFLYAISSVAVLLNMMVVVILFSDVSPRYRHAQRQDMAPAPFREPAAIVATNVALLLACIAIFIHRPPPVSMARSSAPDAAPRSDAEHAVVASASPA